MNVEELEQIALNSQRAMPIKVDKSKRSPFFDGLRPLEEKLGISLVQRRDQIRRNYPTGPIIAAELGCFISTVVGEMQEVEDVEAFGIDRRPILDGHQSLPVARLIVADLNSMPHIPDNTFHYMLSFNCLSYTNITRSFPEIFRVMQAGGIADLDLEFWSERNIPDLMNLPIYKHLRIASVHSGFSGSVKEYIQHLNEKAGDPRMWREGYAVRFELTKPLR
jgi:hypothetical protein